MPALTLQVKEEEFKGLALFVCTHTSRDCRCGTIGTALARRLQTLVEEQGLDLIHVYQVSHVGGHKVFMITARFHRHRGVIFPSLTWLTVVWHLISVLHVPGLIAASETPVTELRKSYSLE